jgi:hypothetical protein
MPHFQFPSRVGWMCVYWILLLRTGLIVGFTIALAVSTKAASITLASINDGVYQYQITLQPGDSVTFDEGSQITLTGLSGITGTSTSTGFTSCGSTDTTACFSEVFIIEQFNNTGGSPISDNLFTITSTSETEGLVNYTANAETPFSGQAEGPLTAPEPGAGLLTAAGMLGLLWFGKRLIFPRLHL